MAISSVGNSLAAIRVDARTEARFSSADTSTTAKLTRQYSAPLQEKAQTANNVELSSAQYDNKEEIPQAGNDSVRVSSSIGRAASAGQLSREEAVAIYQKIADLL